MAKVFDPRRAIHVVASAPHPENTEYRVAWGYEQWDKPVAVTKVQMVYNTRVAGMLSPSYPDNTLDEQAVAVALDLIKKGIGSSSPKSKTVLVLKELDTVSQSLDDVEDQVVDQVHGKYVDALSIIGVSPVVDVEIEQTINFGTNLVGFLLKVETSGYTKSQFMGVLLKHGYQEEANELANWKSMDKNDSGWDGYFTKKYRDIALELGLSTAYNQ